MRFAARHWPIVSGVTALVLALGLGAIVTFRSGQLPFDTAWLEELVEHRTPLLTAPALVMNFLGGGWFAVFVIPLGVPLVLVLCRKRWSALYFLLTSAVAAGLVHLLKALYGRARPSEILVSVDLGSFPSGHVTNAAVIAVALGLLLRRRWVWIVGAAYVLLMALSRTYLGAHWLSDTIGGALTGTAVAILVWAPFAKAIEREWSRSPGTTSVAA